MIVIGLIILLVSVSNIALADDIPDGIAALVDSYRVALDQREIDPLDGMLAGNFDFSGVGPELSRMVFEQVLAAGALSLGEVSKIDVEFVGDTARVTIYCVIEAGGIEQEAMDGFDAILENDEWRIARMGTGALQAVVMDDPIGDATFEIDGPSRTILEFPKDLDHIVVEAEFSDGETVNLIVDNGTPLSVIDSRFASRFEPLGDVTIAKAMGVSGDIADAVAVTVDRLKVGDNIIKDLMAITMDLSHLSEALGIEIAGLLGTDFLGRFAWTIDYSARRIILNRLDNDGNLVEPDDPILSRKPSHTIGFERQLHLLYTTAEFSSKGIVGNIVLDCGAGGGVVTPELFERIPENAYEVGEMDTLLGADKKRSSVQIIIPKKITIGPISRDDYQIVVSDLSHINSAGFPTPVDAIIGYNFFKDWLVTTWYENGVIELRPIPK